LNHTLPLATNQWVHVAVTLAGFAAEGAHWGVVISMTIQQLLVLIPPAGAAACGSAFDSPITYL